MRCSTSLCVALLAVLPLGTAAAVDSAAVINDIAMRWVGTYSNERQVAANLERGSPAAPELTRERRRLVVHRIDAPQFGSTVLFFEEYRDRAAQLAHRQRVVSLVFDAEEDKVRAQQWFFADGPVYDREPLDPAAVARLPTERFRRIPECDLYFKYEPTLDRYRGAMKPRACEYDHPGDGRVYAEFEQLLYPDQHWYRDRSIRIADGTIRGEIDGFSWLLFERQARTAALPALARQEGVWRGTFRRFSPDGTLMAQFPSEIVVRIEREGEKVAYRQSNIYRPEGAPAQRIDSTGEIRDGRIWFANERLSGYAMDIPGDTSGRGAVLVMHFKDGSEQSVYEVITVSADGKRRWRATQYFRDGALTRRTLIDEEKASDDWRAWDAAQATSD